MAVGDFNSDGKLDLAVAAPVLTPGYYASFPGAIDYDVLLGHGDGSFGAPNRNEIYYGDTIYSAAVTVADFNGDGKLDFAMALETTFSSNVTVALGTGTGTLGPASSVTVGYSPQSVAAGDVNGDGKVDLVTANSYDNNVSVLLGTGTGTFGAAQNFAAGLQPRSVAMADFNGDGKIDLLTANAGSVSVLFGTGTGSFSPPAFRRRSLAPAWGGCRRFQWRRPSRRSVGRLLRQRGLGRAQQERLERARIHRRQRFPVDFHRWCCRYVRCHDQGQFRQHQRGLSRDRAVQQ